jgi:hypothetical protein
LFETKGGQNRIESATAHYQAELNSDNERQARGAATNEGQSERPTSAKRSCNQYGSVLTETGYQRTRYSRTDKPADTREAKSKAILPWGEAKGTEHEDGEQGRTYHDQAVHEDRVKEQRPKSRMSQNIPPSVEQIG